MKVIQRKSECSMFGHFGAVLQQCNLNAGKLTRLADSIAHLVLRDNTTKYGQLGIIQNDFNHNHIRVSLFYTSSTQVR